MVFPVLCREIAEPASLHLLDEPQQLLMLVSEFADIIDQFEAWDAGLRRVALADAAPSSRGKRVANVELRAADSPEPEVVRRAVAEFVMAARIGTGPLPDEDPIQFMRHAEAVREILDRRGKPRRV